jgi:hypothetical protein
MCEKPLSPPAHAFMVETWNELEVSMTTLIDVIMLLLAYAGLSLGCAGLIWLLRRFPQRHCYEGLATGGW